MFICNKLKLTDNIPSMACGESMTTPSPPSPSTIIHETLQNCWKLFSI